MKKKLIAVIIIATMLLGMSSTFVLASTEKYNYYVALGDSVTAGCELDGYARGVQGFLPGTYAYDLTVKLGLPTPPETIAPPWEGTNDYQCEIPVYENGFAGGLCGIRTHELRLMLDDNYEPDGFVTDYYWKYCWPMRLEWLQDDVRKKAYRDAIKKADLITINIGNNEVMGILSYMADKYLNEKQASDEVMNEIGSDIMDIASEEMNSVDTDKKIVELADKTGITVKIIKKVIREFVRNQIEFRKNWDWIMKYIYTNNPDVKVVAIGLYNPQTSLGNPIMKSMNRYMRYYSKYSKRYKYVSIWEVGRMIKNGKDAGDGLHPNEEVHQYIANKIYKKIS